MLLHGKRWDCTSYTVKLLMLVYVLVIYPVLYCGVSYATMVNAGIGCCFVQLYMFWLCPSTPNIALWGMANSVATEEKLRDPESSMVPVCRRQKLKLLLYSFQAPIQPLPTFDGTILVPLYLLLQSSRNSSTVRFTHIRFDRVVRSP